MIKETYRLAGVDGFDQGQKGGKVTDRSGFVRMAAKGEVDPDAEALATLRVG
jgi:hypothetical protein